MEFLWEEKTEYVEVSRHWNDQTLSTNAELSNGGRNMYQHLQLEKICVT